MIFEGKFLIKGACLPSAELELGQQAFLQFHILTKGCEVVKKIWL